MTNGSHQVNLHELDEFSSHISHLHSTTSYIIFTSSHRFVTTTMTLSSKIFLLSLDLAILYSFLSNRPLLVDSMH